MGNNLLLALNLSADAVMALTEHATTHGQTVEQIVRHALEEWALNRSICWPDQT